MFADGKDDNTTNNHDAHTEEKPDKPLRIVTKVCSIVFFESCSLKNKDQENIDPMKLEQWSFFVLPTYKIDGYTRSQSSITLNSLSKLVNEIQHSELREEINRAYLEQIKSLSKNTIKP